ncbi:MAG TPA: hypothetical protein VE619_06400, partial [Nitrososphaeraceae archaeon]|nr:hypothetical protein [Nitrososphaeraceae archaeon]
EVYKKRIYRFTELLNPSYNIAANESYSCKVLQNLENKVSEKGMAFDFPDFIGYRCIKSRKNNHRYYKNKNDRQHQFTTLTTYM